MAKTTTFFVIGCIALLFFGIFQTGLISLAEGNPAASDGNDFSPPVETGSVNTVQDNPSSTIIVSETAGLEPDGSEPIYEVPAIDSALESPILSPDIASGVNVTGQFDFANGTQSDDNRTITIFSKENQTLENKDSGITNFRESLNINNSAVLKISVVDTLSEIQHEDSKAFESIVTLSQDIPAVEDKQAMVIELSKMDKEFIKEFSSKVPHTEKQINSYIYSIKEPGRLSVHYNSSTVKKVLFANDSLDDIIDELWS